MHKQRGNISLIILTAAGILILLLVLLFDLCQIFKARERTKNASDSVVLSVSQNLLYFDRNHCMEVAENVASQHDCRLAYLEIEYDWVQAAVEKQIGLVLVDKFISGAEHIRSVSKSRVIYPWDYGFNYCDYYKFDYRED